MKECPKCGFYMDDFDTECKRCHFVPGQEAPPEPTATAPVQSQAAPVQPTAPASAVCPHCSTPLPSPLARVCPGCKAVLMQPVAGARPTATATDAPAVHAVPMTSRPNRWLVLGIGGGTSFVVLIAYFILLATTGTLGGPKLPESTSPSSDSSSFSTSDSPGVDITVSPGFSTPNTPAVSSTAGPSSSLTRKKSTFKSSIKSYEIVGDSATKSGNGWTVSGKIHNIKDKPIGSLNLTLAYEDSNGSQLGTVNVRVANIPPGGEVPFTASIPDARASTYREFGYSSSSY
ncbi:MAG: FxLYD domain-containing protein [Armatimonadota bacterium]